RGARRRSYVPGPGDRRFLGRAAAARERERFRHRGHGGDPRGHPARQPAPGAASRVYRRARFGRRVSHFVEEHAEQVRLAAERIHGRVRRTPTLTTDLDPDLRLKAECFQVTGSFKPRGAFNAVLSLMQRGRPEGVVAVSSGNHAQAVALAARTVGIHALILIPEDANPAEVGAT